MLTRASFDYFVVRIVPEVARQEFINAAVVLYCPERRFLEARIRFSPERLRALWPAADGALIHEHLLALERVCAGCVDGGPIAALSQRERFHWLSAARSTVIQPSPVHTGTCEIPERHLARLVQQFL